MVCVNLEKISELIDGNLSETAVTGLTQHLEDCEECRESQLQFLQLRQQLRSIEIKRDPFMERRVLNEILHSDKPASRQYSFIRSYKYALAACTLIIFGLSAFLLLDRNTDPRSWEVVNIGGDPSIGQHDLGERGRLRIGEMLQTDGGSKARIIVADIGTVEVESETRISLVASGPAEHRLQLDRGSIKAVINAPPKLFFVNTPSATVIDYGCEYTLNVSDDGETVLHVTNGWVSLYLNGRESLVPASAYAKSRPGTGPGTPFFEDASGNFIDALTRFDFENGGASAVEQILSESRQRDAMSLWYLLERTSGIDREKVFERLNSFVPISGETTRQGVLVLDKKMLGVWKEAIDVTSIGESYGRPTTAANKDLRSIGEMSEPRAAHTASLLNDGKVLIAGGFIKEGEITATAEIFDPQDDKFSLVGNLKSPRAFHTATLLPNGKVLLVGGTGQGGLPDQTSEIYDPQTMTFSSSGDLHFARTNHQATRLNDGKILFTGGINFEKAALSEAEIYDPQTGTFSLIGKQNEQRAFHAATLLKNGNVLLTGGSKGNFSKENILNTAEIFDHASQKFRAVNSLTEQRYSHSANLLADGKVLITGGSAADEWKKRLSTAEIFNPDNNSFARIAEMGMPRFNHRSATVTLSNGRVLFAGSAARLEMYDPSANKFLSISGNVGTGRINSTATLLQNGSVLITGGYNLGYPPTGNGWINIPN